tara:strand:- start:10022 stop:10738 length:717 start_codon:yes stop_codon:yes gene_type:complete
MFNPLISPSSVMPAISGIPNYPHGYETVEDKLLLLDAGSGLVDGNFQDFHQHRNFNPTAGIDALGIPNVTSEEILGKPLQNFPDPQAGINKRYPSPESYKFGNKPNGELFGQSGIFITHPPSGNAGNPKSNPSADDYQGSKGSGIFSFKHLFTTLSNAKASKEATGAAGIDDFTIFNPYIHYLPFEGEEVTTGSGTTEPEPAKPVKVPFVSDLIPTKNVWDRYGGEVDEENSDSDPSY